MFHAIAHAKFLGEFPSEIPDVPEWSDLVYATFAIVTHEVRHRIQLQFRPTLFNSGHLDNSVMRTMRFIFERLQAKSAIQISPQLQAIEFDATYIEAMAYRHAVIAQVQEMEENQFDSVLAAILMLQS